MVILNPGRRHRRSRRRSRNSRMTAPRGFFRRRRSHRRNAGFLLSNPFKGSLGTVTKGFSTGAISQAVPLAVGALANRYLQDKAAAMIGSRMGYDLSHGWKNSIVGTATAGALSMVPKYGGPLFAGAMMQVAIKALLPYIPGYDDMKPVPPPPPAPPAPVGPKFSGLGQHWVPDMDGGEGSEHMHMRPPMMRKPVVRKGGKMLPHPAAAPHMGDYGDDYGDFATMDEFSTIGVE